MITRVTDSSYCRMQCLKFVVFNLRAVIAQQPSVYCQSLKHYYCLVGGNVGKRLNSSPTCCINLLKHRHYAQQLRMASTVTDDHKVISRIGMSDLQSLLSNNTTRKYYIEYNGFMSNHICHGIIALYRLGATVEHIQRFIEWYRQKLEPASLYMEQTGATNNNVSELLGARKDYYVIVDHYETLLKTQCNDALEELIAESFPSLSSGLAGSALHGLIHLGYGYSARNSRLVCEGLAYLHFSHSAPRLSNATASSARADSRSPVDVAYELRNNTELHEFVSSEKRKAEWRDISTSDFQRSVGVLFAHRGDYLYELAQSVKLPTIDASDVNASRQLGEWLVNTALTIYASTSRRNDFFLLHGVTGAWALLQVLPLVIDYRDVKSAVRSFLSTLFTVYVAQGTLELRLECFNNPAVKSLSSVVHEVLSGNTEMDEHVFKLIQVCTDMYNVSDDPDLRNIYTWAASNTLNHPLSFG